MAKNKTSLHPDAPLRHPDHARPVSRRDFLAQGLAAGAGVVLAPTLLSFLLGNPRMARAALSADISGLKAGCGIDSLGAGKIPFICFDLAGGANIAGSNVLVGKQGGQMDFLTSAGYSKLGLPGDMIPQAAGAFINNEFGLAFHADSAFVRGMVERVAAGNRASVNGAVIPALSDNDTGNNPHNPMYGVYKAGAKGELLSLIGSVNSDSGGNSMAPAAMIDVAARPTKVDRPSDVTGLVDTGKLVKTPARPDGLLALNDAIPVLEAIKRISDKKLAKVSTQLSDDAAIKHDVECQYVKSADLVDRYGDPSALNPSLDTRIVGNDGSSIFTQAEYDGDGEFRKTAAVMKMVVNGYAGAGTISMGGFDYHNGSRSTGELRDLRAGRCIGACLEYAARVGKPLMIYVFSDGSLASNGMVDNSVEGRGKGVWTGDNSSTAASFFLVYNPAGRPAALRQQIGYFRADGSVESASSPAANNVGLLVETVILNYLALHGEQNSFTSLFPGHGLGNATLRDSLTAFEPIVSGTI